MPCNSVETTSVEFDLKHTSLGLFQKAMESLGYRAQDATTYADENGNVCEFVNGKLKQTFRYGKKLDEAEIKVAYANQVVRYAAKRMGWKVDTKTNKKGRIKKTQ